MNNSSRPSIRDDEVIEKTVLELLPRIQQWAASNGEADTEQQLEETKSNLIDAIKDSHDYDGYSIAKYLDDTHCWSPDSELVEELDSIHFLLSRFEEEHTKEWVKFFKIKPELKVGDPVVFGHKLQYFGHIHEICESTAKYRIQKLHDDENRKYISNYEDTKLAEQTKGAENGTKS